MFKIACTLAIYIAISIRYKDNTLHVLNNYVQVLYMTACMTSGFIFLDIGFFSCSYVFNAYLNNALIVNNVTVAIQHAGTLNLNNELIFMHGA